MLEGQIQAVKNFLSDPAWGGVGTLIAVGAVIGAAWAGFWRFLAKRSEKGTAEKPNGVEFLVELSDEYACDMTDLRLRKEILAALHAVRDGAVIRAQINFEAATPFRKEYQKLKKKKSLSEELLLRRNHLQSFLDGVDSRLNQHKRAIEFLFFSGIEEYMRVEFSDSDWVFLVRGLIDRVNSHGGIVRGKKFDVWNSYGGNVGLGMYLDDDRLDNVLSFLEMESPQQLMGSGWYVGDLPREIVVSHAIPTIICALLFRCKWNELDKKVKANLLAYNLWNVGLG